MIIKTSFNSLEPISFLSQSVDHSYHLLSLGTMSHSETVIDSEVYFKGSAEELYEWCLSHPTNAMSVFSKDSWDYCSLNSEIVYMEITQFQQTLTINTGTNLYRYPITDKLPIIEKFQGIITAGHLIVNDYSLADAIADAFNIAYRMRYYHNTEGKPGLVYYNKLDIIMKKLSYSEMWPLLSAAGSTVRYFVDPRTVDFEAVENDFRLTYVQINTCYGKIDGEVILYRTFRSELHGRITVTSEEDLRELVDSYLKRGYLYVEDPDIIYGYTEEEMEYRVAAFREQTKTIKL